jgi:hypothetical protein
MASEGLHEASEGSSMGLWERAVDRAKTNQRPTNRAGVGCPYPRPPKPWGSPEML